MFCANFLQHIDSNRDRFLVLSSCFRFCVWEFRLAAPSMTTAVLASPTNERNITGEIAFFNGHREKTEPNMKTVGTKKCHI